MFAISNSGSALSTGVCLKAGASFSVTSDNGGGKTVKKKVKVKR